MLFGDLDILVVELAIDAMMSEGGRGFPSTRDISTRRNPP